MDAISARKLAGTMLAVGVATAAIVFGSSAAWTASTTNPGNSVTAATFLLTNSKNAAAVFTAATNAKPGDSNGAGDTVTIKNNNAGGGLPMAMTLAQTGESASNALSTALKLSIHDDTTATCMYPAGAFGASGGSCGSFGNWEGAATLDSLSLTNSANTSNQWPAQEQHVYTVKWSFPIGTTGTTGAGLAASFDLAFNGAQV